MRTVEYYLTLNSPWTYMGSRRFMAIAKAAGVKVDIKPAKFGPIFEKTGGLPLAKRTPERRAYRMMEMKRWRDFHGRPINVEPKFFPADETAGTRLVLRAKLAGLDAVRLSSEIACSQWEMEQNFAEPAVLEAAAKRAGIDFAAIVTSGPSDAELDALHDQYTADALNRGIFGAPSYVLPSGEFFWGQDRLDFLERALKAA